ncbi:hypothetical protein G6F32_016223 [Rhizopus arrhizus]|nr:hypothetical protein G6F32_016223 [Rhizopus arrhizus]
MRWWATAWWWAWMAAVTAPARHPEERGGGGDPCRTAAVRQAGPADRHHRVLDRQCGVPAWRLAADGSAARCRWPDLRDRPGQPDRRRLRCAGQGRFPRLGERAQRRPHSQRRHG